jgi:hypothetical protein
LERYIGVDVPMSYMPALEDQRSEMVADQGHLALTEPQFELWLRPRGSLDLSAANLPDCDVVFIDGDHGEAAVRHDSQLALCVTKNGGLIIWHDAGNVVEVDRVLDRLRQDGWPIETVPDTWLAFMQVRAWRI